MLRPVFFFLLTLILTWAPTLRAQQTNSAQSSATDPNYVLINGDTITFQVIDEPDLSASLLVDKDGQVRPPLLSDLAITGMSIRAAEKYLEKTYTEQEILKRPQVRLNVISYAARLISVLGAVKSPGKVGFSRDTNSIDIVDAISLAGGFSPVARKDMVTVLRTDSNGREETFVLDVEAMVSGKRSADKPREFAIKPGDRIIIKERVF